MTRNKLALKEMKPIQKTQKNGLKCSSFMKAKNTRSYL